MNPYFFNMHKGVSGLPFLNYPVPPYNEERPIRSNDYDGQDALIPEPVDAALTYPDYLEDAAELVEYTGDVLPEPSLDGFDDYGVDGLALAEDEAIAESPFLTDVGYGGETLGLALNPLRDTADSNVALLMYTKVRVI